VLHDRNVTVSPLSFLFRTGTGPDRTGPDQRQNTHRHYEIYSVLLPICTVATAVKAICKYCGSVLDVTILLILLSPVTVQAAVCVKFRYRTSAGAPPAPADVAADFVRSSGTKSWLLQIRAGPLAP